MSKKYKSRGTYLYALRRKKYTRYKKEYLKRQARMRKKGLEMYSEMLTSQELEAVYGAFKRKKIKKPFHRLLSEQQFIEQTRKTCLLNLNNYDIIKNESYVISDYSGYHTISYTITANRKIV